MTKFIFSKGLLSRPWRNFGSESNRPLHSLIRWDVLQARKRRKGIISHNVGFLPIFDVYLGDARMNESLSFSTPNGPSGTLRIRIAFTGRVED